MKHTRIDEGIARGSRDTAVALRPDESTSVVGGSIPDGLDPGTVLALFLDEKDTVRVAAKLGVKPNALTHWLRKTAPEDWKAMQIIRAFSRWDTGEKMMEDASHPLDLARARELTRSAQWALERLDSRTFGPKQEITIADTADLGERLRRAKERVIDSEAAEVPDTKKPGEAAENPTVEKEQT